MPRRRDGGWALPSLWESGIPAVTAMLPARFTVKWKGMVCYAPLRFARLAARTDLARPWLAPGAGIFWVDCPGGWG